MKKIGLVTIFDREPNYGNKLQNYAAVQILSQLGFKVDTVVTTPQENVIEMYIKQMFNKILGGKISDYQEEWIKRCNFGLFNYKYLSPVYSLLKGKIISEQYDFFAIGSDQVWNPLWLDGIKKSAFFLDFADKDKKICISPSFGVDEIPMDLQEYYREKLLTFNNLSVREKAGVDIVRQLIGKTPEVLIDPTMMLEANQWSRIAKKPRKVNFDKPYVLTYFLGGRSEKINSDIDEILKERDYSIYHLLDKSQPEVFVSGPSEFIYLISHASLVLTDSFHACVFSFIFDIPFLVYQRQNSEANMMSRITTLLGTFDLERKYVDSGLANDLFECDYRNGFVILENERKRMNNFIRKSLEINEKGKLN